MITEFINQNSQAYCTQNWQETVLIPKSHGFLETKFRLGTGLGTGTFEKELYTKFVEVSGIK